GIRSVSFKVNNHEITKDDTTYGTITLVDSGTYSKQNTHWSVTINPSAFEGATTDDINFYGIVTDDAGVGNQQMLSLATFIRDIDGPEVTLNSPKDADISTSNIIEVNKTITLNGTASDINGLSTSTNMELYFTKSSTLGNVTTAPTLSEDTTDADGNPVEGNIGSTGADAETKWVSIDDTRSHSNSWSFGGINTATLGGLTIEDGTEVYFTVKATDKAGNSSCAVPVKVTVDQNTDRPILSYNNLSWDSTANSNAGGVKEYNKNLSTLSGIITDDDGITKLCIAVADNQPSDLKTNSSYEITVNSTGAFSVPLGDDGSKTLWIYVKDTAGTEFITAATQTSGTTTTANPLAQPYLVFNGHKDSNNADIKSDDSTATTFKINNNPPVINKTAFGFYGTTAEGTVQTAPAQYYEFDNTNNYAGGSVRKNVVFEITAIPSNNVPIESVSLSVTGIPAGTTFTFTKAEDTTVGGVAAEIWRSAAVDVKSLTNPWTSGTKSLTYTVVDKSGLSATSETKQLVIDNESPKVTLISPGGDEVTGVVTLSGSTTDTHTVDELRFKVVDNRYFSSYNTLNTDAQTAVNNDAKTATTLNAQTNNSTFSFVLNGTAVGSNVNPRLPTSTAGVSDSESGINLAPRPAGYGENDDTRQLT
ncbi:MAG: hypothetical protein IKN54_01355, partial [Lachnospiraceae bacterium]|nr:hypothetical protein [Lachnospiraceae bacterium]